MTIRQLEYFCAVAENHSISAAARALHVAQPPISRQIAQLEDELGVQLFARESRGMKLTEAGQALYRQSRQLFLRLRRVEENVKSIGAGEGGRINVGVIYSAMPYALHSLEEYHPATPRSNSTFASVRRRTCSPTLTAASCTFSFSAVPRRKRPGFTSAFSVRMRWS